MLGCFHIPFPVSYTYRRAVWESEEWLQAHAKPLDESGGQGVQAALPPSSKTAAAAAAANGHDVAME